MKTNGTLKVDSVNDLVVLRFGMPSGQIGTVVLPSWQARELARTLTEAAQFADAAALGAPQGSA
jgi:hypothetical protein